MKYTGYSYISPQYETYNPWSCESGKWNEKVFNLICFVFHKSTSSVGPLGTPMWRCEYICCWCWCSALQSELKEEVWGPHRPPYNPMNTLFAGVCSTCWKRDVFLPQEEEIETCECPTKGLALTHPRFLKGHQTYHTHANTDKSPFWQGLYTLQHLEHHLCCSFPDAVGAVIVSHGLTCWVQNSSKWPPEERLLTTLPNQTFMKP